MPFSVYKNNAMMADLWLDLFFTYTCKPLIEEQEIFSADI